MFKLIKIKDRAITGLVVENSTVEYSPCVKYRVEKQSALDPTIIIKREPYHEDILNCETIILPQKYNDLIIFLASHNKFYIEFETAYKIMQLPVVVDKLPVLAASQINWCMKVKFTLKAVYQNHLNIDFNNLFGYGNKYNFNYGY